ncbi:putative membrane transporter protein [Hyphomicrobiales bacterium]|nr:putative membrane transporter protein [Hyphomicrobiales bacterium]CAH1657128.1 putative membrane transporter protein [Chelatococcus asaccharovorans]CAH1661046.1 putative membrane transporter protein [Hyphomicrobiales bacterium]CAH1693305.1 putative membrane transporter protein [Hyphomicrobiales bacterium]CAH1695196.1 putative membrane transporter protein [Chelatococcus asaccharovorans]
MIVVVTALGFGAAWLQYGFIPNGDRPYAIAGVSIAIWHLVWMGIWTGYTMALVGQAAGIFALPYSTSVLQFSNPHVSPTMLVLTFVNPAGALLGYRRSGQWNLDLALAVCLGGVAGAIVGPLFRATVLMHADPFRLTLGIALAAFGLQLCWKAARDYSRFGRSMGRDFAEDSSPSTMRFEITTTEKNWRSISIKFGRHHRTLPNLQLFAIGAGVGVFSSALGVGGGFLLVPIFAIAYRLPLYVMVAATIPYSIVLSFVGILTFVLVLPAIGIEAISPEWSWGFFTAAGGLFGSWCASKTQLYVPEHVLNGLLGSLTSVVGIIYILSFVIKLPFSL